METLFEENPELYEELDLIIYERDNDCKSGGDRLFCDYEKLYKKFREFGFKQIAFHGYGTQDIVLAKNNRS